MKRSLHMGFGDKRLIKGKDAAFDADIARSGRIKLEQRFKIGACRLAVVDDARARGYSMKQVPNWRSGDVIGIRFRKLPLFISEVREAPFDNVVKAK